LVLNIQLELGTSLISTDVIIDISLASHQLKSFK